MSYHPRVIAHRGASGERPEHTLAAYQLAIEQGADAIELDLVPCRDGTLIARHDSELSITTDVADRSEFAERRRIQTIEGVALAGWFVEDFTAAEIAALRARQRFPFRSPAFNDQFPIPTLADVLALVQRAAQGGRSVGVYLELKHPTHFASIGLPFEDSLQNTLAGANLPQSAQVVIESFEPGILQQLRGRRSERLCQLIDHPSTTPQFAQMLTRAGLATIAGYADGIGVNKHLIIPQTSDPRLSSPPTSLIDDAHGAGLFVDAWTFRDEPRFIAAGHHGDAIGEYRRFFDLGLDGAITDFPKTAIRARQGNTNLISPQMGTDEGG